MDQLHRPCNIPSNAPIKIVQFGEGNFLRAFSDYMVDVANEWQVFSGSIAVVKPIPYGSLAALRQQEYCYTVRLCGIEDGTTREETRIITCISDAIDPFTEYDRYLALARIETLEFVFSNTTEAGIVYDMSDTYDTHPNKTFPGKVTAFLYERYRFFSGSSKHGLVFLPVELIDKNGDALKRCVFQYIAQWGLGDSFAQWVEQANIFCNTLVDRIVTGHPANAEALFEQLGYRDDLLVAAEPFGLWVIESQTDIANRFPLDKTDLPVLFTRDLSPYRERKVRILNGAHTAMVPAAFLSGKNTVLECMEDKDILSFLQATIEKEIAPFVSLPMEESLWFVRSVLDRFQNPFIRHELLSICLNSVSKWKTRVLPSFLDYVSKHHVLPPNLTFSFAALISFYRHPSSYENVTTGIRCGQTYPLRDDAAVLTFFASCSSFSHKEYATACATRADFWGMDLTTFDGFSQLVTYYLTLIEEDGIAAVLHRLATDQWRQEHE